MAITTLDQFLAALPGQRFNFQKDDSTVLTAGRMVSLWRKTGQPDVGTDPATTNGVVPDDATAGSIVFTNGTLHLARLSTFMGQPGTVFIYDRVLHSNGFTITAVPGAPVSVTRPAAAQVNELFIEVYTATTTSRPVSITYMNGAGVGSRTSATVTLPISPVGTMIPVPLQSGDTGVRRIEGVTTLSTGGSWGLTVMNRLGELIIKDTNASANPDAISQLGFPDVANDACIAFAVIPSGTSTGRLIGALTLVTG